MYKEIPFWNDGNWETSVFNSKEEFRDFVLRLFKEPGKYEFNETSFLFKEQAALFDKNGFLCP